MENRRWYFSNEELASCIEHLEKTNSSERNRLVYGIMRLINRHGPDLLDNFVRYFPLDVRRHQWYDHDPNHWLAINGLQYGGEVLQKMVARYLASEIRKTTDEAATYRECAGPSLGEGWISRTR